MASLVQWLKFSGARNTDGTPISSGSAYFYAVGSTSELLTLYSDAAETTTISNPAVLDAAGKASVYVKLPGQVLVKNAAGTTILQADSALSPTANQVIVRNINYYGSDGGVYGYGKSLDLDTILTNLATSLGVDSLYKESVTATARPIQDLLRDAVTPEDFGAVGDGIVNDATALQNAINRACAAGKPLKLGPHTYKITSALSITSPIDIVGAGINSSIINCTSETNALTIGIAVGTYSIRDCAFVTTSTADDTCGIEIDTYSDAGSFVNVRASGRWGFRLGTAAGTRLINCVGEATDASGAETGGTAFQLGGYAIAVGCTATNTYPGDKDDIGFYFGTGSVAIGCKATASNGYVMTSVSEARAIACTSTSVDSFILTTTSNSGAVLCSATSSGDDFTSTNGTSVLNHSNSWNLYEVERATATTSSAGTTVTFTPAPATGYNQVIKLTANDTIALTIAAPATTIPKGVEFAVIIQSDATAKTVNPTWNSAYKGTVATALIEGECRMTTFISNGAGVYVAKSTPIDLVVNAWT